MIISSLAGQEWTEFLFDRLMVILLFSLFALVHIHLIILSLDDEE